MINKLVVDNVNITLNESTVLPFTYTFSMAGVHNVRIGLDNTNEICAYAFKDCEDLTKVKNIPEKITMIKRNAFENCVNLSKFDVPSSIEYIGPNVFDGCTSLKEIKFNSSTPPNFFAKLSDETICYIPDNSKFIAVENNDDLVKDGSVHYYEKNILGGYEEVDFEALDNETQYYYDNWVDVHNHYNTVEERFRIKPQQIQFYDEGYPTSSFGNVTAGEEGEIFEYRFIPEETTNQNVYIYSSNPNVLTVDQLGHFKTNSELLGNSTAVVYVCAEPDYYGTYAFAQLRFSIKSTKSEPELSLDTNTIKVMNTNDITLPVLNNPEELEITYSSSDENIVTVDSNGIIHIVEGVKYGDAVISITSTKTEQYVSKTVKYTVQVRLGVDPELSIDKESITIENSNNIVLPIITKPEDAEVIYSSSDENVITVDENGQLSIVEGIKSGQATITITIPQSEKYNVKSVSYVVIVRLPESAEITLNGVEYENNLAYIKITDTNNFTSPTLSGVPEGMSVEYISSNTDVVTVNENGKLTIVEGVTEGTSNITINIIDNNATDAHNYVAQIIKYTVKLLVTEIVSEYETDDEGNIHIINNDQGALVETEYESDENGNIQLINNDDDGLVETEYDTDENGSVQIINNN